MSLIRGILLFWLIQLVALVAPTESSANSEAPCSIEPDAGLPSATDGHAYYIELPNLRQHQQQERDLDGKLFVGAPGIFIDFNKNKSPAPQPASSPAPAPTSAVNNINATYVPQVIAPDDDDNTDDFIPKLPASVQAQIAAKDSDDNDVFVPVPAPTFQTEGLLVGYKDKDGTVRLNPGMEVPVEFQRTTIRSGPKTIYLNSWRRLLIFLVACAIAFGCCSPSSPCRLRWHNRDDVNTKKDTYPLVAANSTSTTPSPSDTDESALEMGSLGSYRDDDTTKNSPDSKIKGRVRRIV